MRRYDNEEGDEAPSIERKDTDRQAWRSPLALPRSTALRLNRALGPGNIGARYEGPVRELTELVDV